MITLSTFSDPAAIVAVVLLLFQVGFLLHLRGKIDTPLRTQRILLTKVRARLRQDQPVHRDMFTGIDAFEREALLPRFEFWESLITSETDREEADAAIDRLFNSSSLLPSGYSQRLDLAAPGLFIAIGILGTFVGLIFVFSSAGIGKELEVGTLMQGMQAPFFNSAVGVLIACTLTYSSRSHRHRHETACLAIRVELRRQAQNLIPRTRRLVHEIRQLQETLTDIREGTRQSFEVGTATHEQLSKVSKGLAGGFESVVAATADSSKQLVADLAPKLEASMRTLVNAPFTELIATINLLDENTRALTDRQVEVVGQMHEAGRSLSAAHQALTSTTGAITAQSEALQSGAKALADGTQHVSETINQANATVTDLTQVRNWIEAGSARLGEVLGSLETTREALTAVSGVLEGSAGRYDVSATGFNDAVATLQSSMTKALDQSLDPVTRELREAVELMQSALATTVAQLRLDLTETTKSIAETLAESSASTIAAYSTASSGVNTVLEDHMDGVVDRLNGQLGALQRMVPDEISRLTQASVQSAKTLEKAVRQLEAVVGTVNEKSTASLKGQLESYDKAVAEIHQRLAGTLALWETRAESLETAVVRLSDAVDRVRVS